MKEQMKYFEDKNITSNIFAILGKKDQNLILREIKNMENKNIDLENLIEEDQNKNTLLISSVYFNLSEVSEYLIDYFRNKIKSTTKFLDYLNLRNKKGYDALLYAAYRGNFPIFQKLLDNGAYLNSTNITGLNVLHLAAQGNCLNIITSLTEKYIFNINSQDNNGNTALHWAVYFNNQQSIDYLLFFNIDINLKDNNNRTALDIAIERENDILIDRIKDGIITKYNSPKNSYNISRFFTKFEIIKIWLRIYLHYFFLIFLIFSEICNQKLIFLGINNYKINITFFIMFLLLSYYYFFMKLKPENKNKNKPKISKNTTLFSFISQSNDLSNVCPWCIGYINANSYHCPYCKKCINFQEFHNSLLNNCITKDNFKNYLFYLFFFTFIFIFKFFVSIYAIKYIEYEIIKENKFFVFWEVVINLSFCGLGMYRIVRKIKLFNISQNENKIGRYTKEINNFFPELDNKISGLEF